MKVNRNQCRTTSGLILSGLLVGSAGAASAAEGDLLPPVQQFTPAVGGPTNFINVDGASTVGNMNPAFELYLNYGFRPLVLSVEGNEAETIDLVRHQVQADILAAYGFGDRFQLGLALPVTLFQASGGTSDALGTAAEISSTVLGDIRLIPKFNVLTNDSGLGVALALPIILPTGNESQYQGNPGIAVEPRAIVELKPSDALRLGANLGVLVRGGVPDDEFYNIGIGNEFSYGLGFGYMVNPSKLEVVADAHGRMAAFDKDTDLSSVNAPLELDLGARLWAAEKHIINVGLGTGLTDGYGSPRFRLYAGYTMASTTPPDADGDGIVNKDDQCPRNPEDLDGFQDDNGCPDPDNDGDGIPDTEDRCANDPEDKDNFEDGDGCPDPDNDKDGVADTSDKCPLEPEDKDFFEDDDGCAELDNDKDTIPDKDDKCPNGPEDWDGFEDGNGCPERDNDKDGFLDANDKCPNDAEIINGVDDTDGCPDKGKTLVNVTGTKIEILDKVYFDLDKATIQKRSYPVLKQVAVVLKTHPEITKIRIEGHTDNQGNDDHNMKLSQARAEAVRDFMVKEGVDVSRFEAVGYGETKPIADNNTKTGQATNRRVEFNIIEIDGKPADAQTIESPANP